MQQLIYISTAVGTPAVADILAVSRRNNRRDGISGLLYADGTRFMQALEGPDEMVVAAFERIARDPRHRATVVLSRRRIDAREFGTWDMAARVPGEKGAAFVARIEALVARTAPDVRATFDGFARLRNAA